MRYKRRKSGHELQPETKAEDEWLQWLISKIAPVEDMNEWLRRTSAEEKAARTKLMKLQMLEIKERRRNRKLREMSRKGN